VNGNGETAWEDGRYTLLGTNGSTMDDGKYIVVWKHEADGWKMYRDMWSSNSPQQPIRTARP
jgi:ketosteroid isomerase-like protein